MVTRTTTTRPTSFGSGQSADLSAAASLPFTLADLLTAYHDCRKRKMSTLSALEFEVNLERNLVELRKRLLTGTYHPGQSICFVITRPKHREVWAAKFEERIVHHLLYNHIGKMFEASFIPDSCACIPGRGTLYGAKRLESKVRSITENWTKPAWYLKADMANFFVSIDKNVLSGLLAKKIHEPWWLKLAQQVLMHDPRENYILKGAPALLDRVPAHKRLLNQPAHLGLPIGNLSSQFFANIYLNELDQFVKHTLKAKHYIRYVDDIVLLHESPQTLNRWLAAINEFLPSIGAKLNPKKTILQPLQRGVDFVGQVIKPHRRVLRKKTANQALNRLKQIPANELWQTTNSYFGLFRQASHSHHQRAQAGNIVLLRGKAINQKLTKTYRGNT